MRLDWDCIRDILLCVEEETGLRKRCHFSDTSDQAAQIREFLGESFSGVPEYQVPLDEKHGNESVMYHVLYCCREDVALLERLPGAEIDVTIADLTQQGHEMADLIRPVSFWKGLQKTLDAAGTGAYGTAIADVLKTGSELLRKKILGQ